MPKRIVPPPDDSQGRVETGGVRFGDDWPGFFLRGDNAFHLAHTIKVFAESIRPLLIHSNSDKVMLAALESYASRILQDVPLPNWYQEGDSDAP